MSLAIYNVIYIYRVIDSCFCEGDPYRAGVVMTISCSNKLILGLPLLLLYLIFL